MTSILSQYMMRTILASTALVLVVLLALAGLFEFIAELDDTQGNYQTPQAILFTSLRLPNLAFEMLPVAALIGSLLGLGALAANSEIIVMRAAGLSFRDLAAMVGSSGFVMLVFTALLGEFIGPPLDFYARDMRNTARHGQEDERLGNATWVKDGNSYLHLERVNSEFEFGNMYIYRFDDQGSGWSPSPRPKTRGSTRTTSGCWKICARRALKTTVSRLWKPAWPFVILK